MSPVLILVAAWLLVIGYGLIFVGYENGFANKKVSFQDAFFPQGLFGSFGGSGTQVTNKEQPLSPLAGAVAAGGGRPLTQ